MIFRLLYINIYLSKSRAKAKTLCCYSRVFLCQYLHSSFRSVVKPQFIQVIRNRYHRGGKKITHSVKTAPIMKPKTAPIIVKISPVAVQVPTHVTIFSISFKGQAKSADTIPKSHRMATIFPKNSGNSTPTRGKKPSEAKSGSKLIFQLGDVRLGEQGRIAQLRF